MSDKITLKPCPFCGEKLVHDSEYYSGPIWKRLNEAYRVECPKCYAQTTEYQTAEKAIKAWNSRPIEKKALRLLKSLVDDLNEFIDDPEDPRRRGWEKAYELLARIDGKEAKK